MLAHCLVCMDVRLLLFLGAGFLLFVEKHHPQQDEVLFAVEEAFFWLD